jgi:hypothetical protein
VYDNIGLSQSDPPPPGASSRHAMDEQQQQALGTLFEARFPAVLPKAASGKDPIPPVGCHKVNRPDLSVQPEAADAFDAFNTL